MAVRQLVVLVAITTLCGCPKKPPTTTHVEFDDEVIRLMRNRPADNVETQAVPGDDLKSDQPVPASIETAPVPTPAADRGAAPHASSVVGIFLVGSAEADAPPPWHCFKGTLSEVGEIGECWSWPAVCEERREGWSSHGARVGPSCGTQPRAACYYSEQPLHDAAAYLCYESFAACLVSRSVALLSPEQFNVGKCHARRMT